MFLAVQGLHCCAGFSLVVVSGGCFLVAVFWLLIAVASLVAELGLNIINLQILLPILWVVFSLLDEVV